MRRVALAEGALARMYARAYASVCPRAAFRCVRRVRRGPSFGALPSIRLDMQIIRGKNRPGMRRGRYN